jgi:hypothetical protein
MLVMLNLFQHPWEDDPARRARWGICAMDAEPKAGAAKPVQHDEALFGM